MSAPDNFRGGLYQPRGRDRSVRASRTSISFRGVDIDIDYTTSGTFLAATDVDDASSPTAHVLSMEISGQDATKLLEDFRSEIEECIERTWSES